MREKEPLLTSRQIADVLNVHPATVAAWVKQGKLKAHYTPGGHLRFREQDVDEAMTRGRNGDEAA